MIEETKLQAVLEAVILAAGHPLSEEDILKLFTDEERPSKQTLRAALKALQESSEERGVILAEVSSGYQFQVKLEWAPMVSRLWEEKAPRYSRALFETLALIAYRQPITRGEIEEIRGVSLSPSIFKTLLEEREWIRIVGHREVPGRPALYATTKNFLDYFGLKSLEELPSLPDIMNLDAVELPKISEFSVAEIQTATEKSDVLEVNQKAIEAIETNETNEHDISPDIESSSIEVATEITEITEAAIEETMVEATEEEIVLTDKENSVLEPETEYTAESLELDEEEIENEEQCLGDYDNPENEPETTETTDAMSH